MVHVDRWSKRRSLSRDCDRLISDAEAFLSGDYENHVRRHDRRVPGWARLNRFAHGDLRIVRRARRPFAATKSAAFADWPEEAWRSAQRIVASELLALVGDSPGLLLQLQRSVLVPLETRVDRRRGQKSSDGARTRASHSARAPAMRPGVER
jgi:hypothetical protein